MTWRSRATSRSQRWRARHRAGNGGTQAEGRTPGRLRAETKAGAGAQFLLLGAGCSRSADIPLAAEVAKLCAEILKLSVTRLRGRRTSVYEDAKVALAALVDRGIVPDRFVLSDGEGTVFSTNTSSRST
ncbi:hypothetical protein AB5I41_16445 [Sphingomonas sp. MMS24-JH45]